MKKVSVFGSTGFIGKATVGILSGNTEDFKVIALVAGSNVSLLAQQAKLLNAEMAVIADDDQYEELKRSLHGSGIRVAAGKEAVLEAAALSVDTAVMAITGIVALGAVMRLIESGVGTIALASKESVVCGGVLLRDAACKSGTRIVPVDSEHNAVFRLLSQGDNPYKITITASGGPFLHWSHDQLKSVTIEDALVHPVWKMGKKISVDSATMMNKALEVLEASYLFELGYRKIDVVIHPESIVHALAFYQDGTSTALMSLPDMSIPILHALYWPHRKEVSVREVDLIAYGKLTFIRPDFERFPALKAAFDILQSSERDVASIVFNAANEVAVESFLNSEITFLEIVNIVLHVMNKVPYGKVSSLADIMEYDLLGRCIAREVISDAS
ncbi:1-deoxy-D-xylulose 5-phosphate reductoisomerase [Anaplasma phagocytophilum str. MRK]|uniref:1-deoxy-D-xylulose-5-phosphate reductoisomerase n=1 Tax=Anaplasma phagocytophilum TaxID=948 RepID=UPI0005338B17|nr:1-deoxy-D-xylulose-5-phosphate reductoisomerase [Anaplasma phagocytophilum]KDB55861.1 1-deoxy-D-xylulose 5-phosphate reductoisomerase [Anaplasma phagocytophilum str. MRK]